MAIDETYMLVFLVGLKHWYTFVCMLVNVVQMSADCPLHPGIPQRPGGMS